VAQRLPGVLPLMKVVRDQLQHSKEQIGWCIIGSVSITVLARLFILHWMAE